MVPSVRKPMKMVRAKPRQISDVVVGLTVDMAFER